MPCASWNRQTNGIGPRRQIDRHVLRDSMGSFATSMSVPVTVNVCGRARVRVGDRDRVPLLYGDLRGGELVVHLRQRQDAGAAAGGPVVPVFAAAAVPPVAAAAGTGRAAAPGRPRGGGRATAGSRAPSVVVRARRAQQRHRERPRRHRPAHPHPSSIPSSSRVYGRTCGPACRAFRAGRTVSTRR